MDLIGMSVRGRHCSRLFFKRKAATPHSRAVSTSPVHRGVLGLDRGHWSKPTELSRGLTRPEMMIRKAMEKANPNRIKVYPCPIPSARAHCKDPIASIMQKQLLVLDPTGARARLFNKTNLEGARVGDILLVRTKEGDPLSGVCMNIRRQGIDTAILLRNNLTRVGVEMWIKIFSPNVEGVEVVQRKEKKARRARLYYMRKPKHDAGSVLNVVQQYMRQRQALRSGGDSTNRDQKSPRRKNKRK